MQYSSLLLEFMLSALGYIQSNRNKQANYRFRNNTIGDITENRYDNTHPHSTVEETQIMTGSRSYC